MEDFGWAGDETLLDGDNFAMELNTLRGWAEEEEARALMADAEAEYESAARAEWEAEARWEAEAECRCAYYDDEGDPYSGTYSEE